MAKTVCARCGDKLARHISRSMRKVRRDRHHDLCPRCAASTKDSAYVVTDTKEVVRDEPLTVEDRMQERIRMLEERLAGYEDALDLLAGAIQKGKPVGESSFALVNLLVQRGTEDATRAAAVVERTYRPRKPTL